MSAMKKSPIALRSNLAAGALLTVGHAAFLLGYLVFTLVLVRRIAAAQAERVNDEMPAARVVS